MAVGWDVWMAGWVCNKLSANKVQMYEDGTSSFAPIHVAHFAAIFSFFFLNAGMGHFSTVLFPIVHPFSTLPQCLLHPSRKLHFHFDSFSSFRTFTRNDQHAILTH